MVTMMMMTMMVVRMVVMMMMMMMMMLTMMVTYRTYIYRIFYRAQKHRAKLQSVVMLQAAFRGTSVRRMVQSAHQVTLLWWRFVIFSPFVVRKN